MSDIEGFIVAGYERDRLVDSWDGEIHQTREDAERSLSECHAAGYRDWSLYEVRAVAPTSVERKRTDDERRIEAVYKLLDTSRRKTIPLDELRKALSPAVPSEGGEDQ